MKDLPVEHVFLYRRIDPDSGATGPTEVIFVNLPPDYFDWREIGVLEPDDTGRYFYSQISHWPKPNISARILRTIADRIETLNRRAQAK